MLRDVLAQFKAMGPHVSIGRRVRADWGIRQLRHGLISLTSRLVGKNGKYDGKNRIGSAAS